MLLLLQINVIICGYVFRFVLSFAPLSPFFPIFLKSFFQILASLEDICNIVFTSFHVTFILLTILLFFRIFLSLQKWELNTSLNLNITTLQSGKWSISIEFVNLCCTSLLKIRKMVIHYQLFFKTKLLDKVKPRFQHCPNLMPKSKQKSVGCGQSTYSLSNQTFVVWVTSISI